MASRHEYTDEPPVYRGLVRVGFPVLEGLLKLPPSVRIIAARMRPDTWATVAGAEELEVILDGPADAGLPPLLSGYRLPVVEIQYDTADGVGRIVAGP